MKQPRRGDAAFRPIRPSSDAAARTWAETGTAARSDSSPDAVSHATAFARPRRRAVRNAADWQTDLIELTGSEWFRVEEELGEFDIARREPALVRWRLRLPDAKRELVVPPRLSAPHRSTLVITSTAAPG